MKRRKMKPKNKTQSPAQRFVSCDHPGRSVSLRPLALGVLLRTCNMNNTIARDLATETSVELAHHKEFKGKASNAAEFVLFKAVRENRLIIQHRRDVPEIIKALTALVRTA
jgi:hypothetical protein